MTDQRVSTTKPPIKTPELTHIKGILVLLDSVTTCFILLENVTTRFIVQYLLGANRYNRYGLLISVRSSPADYNDDHPIQYFMVQYH